jgi:hypothetical protein
MSNILELIPEVLREDLIEEVKAVLKSRGLKLVDDNETKKPEDIENDIKSWASGKHETIGKP